VTVKKLMVIGLDGATWHLLDPWIKAGYLPNLAALRARGASGPLASVIQPLSSAAWTSFLTGMNQGKHGIFDFVRRKADTYALELTDATMIQAPTLFEYLGQAGLRLASINMPFTFPVWPVQGVMVAGPFAPSLGPMITHPPGLWDELHKAVPDYEILPDYDARAKDPEAKLAADLVRCVSNRTRAAEFVLEREAWDVFMVVYTSTDQVQHAFWHYLPETLAQAVPDTSPMNAPPRLRDAILAVYREVDAGIGRLLQHVEPETPIIVLSDHGAGRLDWWVHLNAWLAQQGYLVYQRQARTSVRGRLTHMATQLIKIYSRAVPQPIRRQIRILLGKHFSTIKERLETSALTGSVDWSRTRVYALGSGDIYVNMRGREPQGIVSPGPEYESLRDEVIAGFQRLTTPDGRPLVEHIYRREALYQGEHAQHGPDLTVVLADHRFHPLARFAASEAMFEDPRRWRFDARPLTGGHRLKGIIILAGDGVQAGAELEGARLIDLAPTILAWLGLPVPEQMDGRALVNAFRPEAEIAGTIKSISDVRLQLPGQTTVYSEEEKAAIEQHLSELGYL